MIKANTVMKSSTNGNMKLDGSVMIDPEIILHAMETYMVEVQNEQN